MNVENFKDELDLVQFMEKNDMIEPAQADYFRMRRHLLRNISRMPLASGACVSFFVGESQ